MFILEDTEASIGGERLLDRSTGPKIGSRLIFATSQRAALDQAIKFAKPALLRIPRGRSLQRMTAPAQSGHKSRRVQLTCIGQEPDAKAQHLPQF